MTKMVFSSIVIVPSLMILSWLIYMSLNPIRNTDPYAVSMFLTFNSIVPRYQFLGDIAILLLLGAVPLALFPYIHILKKYYPKKYIWLSIIFYVIGFLILKLLLPEEISLYGTDVLQKVESILNHIHPILFSLAKLFLYFISILALVGFFIEVYAGTKYKRNEYTLLACWVVMILIFIAVLPLTYPRYLLPVIPAFLMVISLEIERFSKKNKKSKQISYIVFIALMLTYLTVGLFKCFSF
jgi:4-amino-4-deoxy-L-arabinose transferase-like glycosyltransferase